MKSASPSRLIPRREFLTTGAGLTAAVAPGPVPAGSGLGAAASSATRKSIGIQTGAVSFVDEGAEKVLEILQARGAVDAISLTTFTYGGDWPGRARFKGRLSE
jgi:hypothetical protein